MTRWARNRLAKVLAGIAVAGLAATWAVGDVLSSNEGTRRDKHEVSRMTEKMKTVCVGRVLIDLPEDAQVELASASIDGFNIAAFDETPEEFQSRVVEREAQIRAKPDRLGGNRNLEIVKDVKSGSGLVGKIFVHSRTVTEGTAANGLALERYRYEGIAVEALVHGNGVSIDLAAEDYDPDLVDNLSRLVALLVPNAKNQVPKESGFCIDRAYFRDPLKAEQLEQIMMFARLPDRPDIQFMLILAAGVKPDEEGLLQRDAAAEARLSLADRMRLTRLRAGARVIGGLSGEEVIRGTIEENDANVYNFWWEVNGTEDNVLVPHLVFQMNTGKGDNGPVPSSLSEGAALGLWDKVSSSIRIRSVTTPSTGRPEAPPVPIGTYAWAGDRCPETGWWLCGDGGNGLGVLGGQRQYLRKGQKMPQALLLPPQTVWQRMRGLQPSYESKTRTGWKLVDKRERDRSPPAVPLAQATLVAQADSGSAIDSAHSTAYPEVTIGCVAKTGMQCPASGWWRCEESHALDGTRWFAAGSLLPAATFEVSAATFGRAFGARQAIQRRSVWQLMRHSAHPGEAPLLQDMSDPEAGSGPPAIA